MPPAKDPTRYHLDPLTFDDLKISRSQAKLLKKNLQNYHHLATRMDHETLLISRSGRLLEREMVRPLPALRVGRWLLQRDSLILPLVRTIKIYNRIRTIYIIDRR